MPFEEDDAARIWREITGRRLPQIITLSPYVKQDLRTRPTLAVAESYSRVAGFPRSDPAEVTARFADMLSRFDKLKLLTIATNVNARLLAADSRRLHRQLENDLLTPELREGLDRVRAGDDRPDESYVFTRRALLLIARLALGLAPADVEEDFEEVHFGELALIANEFFDRQNDVLVDRPDDEHDDVILLESLTTWDLFNAGDVGYQIARYGKLYEDLYSDDPEITRLRAVLPLPEPPCHGLTIGEQQTVVFLMYLLLHEAVEKGEAPIIRVESPLPDFLPSPAKIVAALDAQSWMLGQFDDAVVKPPWTSSSLSQLLNSPRAINDNTWVRQKPLIKLPDGRYMAPDYRVALNRMTAGVYWTLFDALPSNRRNDLASLWGVVVERYVGKLLRHYYPHSPVLAPRLQMNVQYSDGATTGEIDALLDEGDAALVFEVKASPLPVELRASRDMGRLRRWVHDRLVESEGARKGVVQLRDAAVAVLRQSVSISPQVQRVYPVLVLDDVVFECFGFNRMLASELECRLDESQRVQIQPLTVMSIGELEKALPFIAEGRFGWEEILRERLDGRNVSWFSFSQTVYNHQRVNGRQGEGVLNSFLNDEFDAFVTRLRDAIQEEEKHDVG